MTVPHHRRPFTALRVGLLAALAVGALTLSGCGRRAPTPEDTFRTFHQALVQYSRSGHPGYRGRAYDLLTENSRKMLARRAEQVNATLPDGIEKLTPAEMLQVRTLRVDKPIDDVSIEEVGEGRVKVVARLDDCREEGDKIQCSTLTLPMEREGGGWRVDLLTSAEP